MTNAAITGWGACMPPAVLTNADLATFLDTDDAWIASRTGMKERRISHVPAIEMATVAARRAIACAGLEPADIDLVLYGSCGAWTGGEHSEAHLIRCRTDVPRAGDAEEVTMIEAQPMGDATSSSWTRPRQCQYRQSTVHASWGGTCPPVVGCATLAIREGARA